MFVTSRALITLADALSQVDVAALSQDGLSVIDFKKMASAQLNDPDLLVAQSSSLDLKAIPLPSADGTIVCDMSTGTPRPFVPAAFCQHIFDTMHSLSHPSIQATRRLIAARYVWPNMNVDIGNWTRSCVVCQQAKVQRHTVTPLSTFIPPGACFDTIHLDITLWVPCHPHDSLPTSRR